MGVLKHKNLIAKISLIMLAVLVAGGVYYVVRRSPSLATSKSVASEENATSSTASSVPPGPPGISTAPKPQPAQTPSPTYIVITENEQFKIRREENTSHYVITLYAIINRPDQYDTYRAQLRDYKQKALQYLQDKNIDITKATITYEPPEATSL